MENKYWYIKRSDIFSVMSHEEMEKLASLSTMCEFKKGATIYLLDEPSEHVYLLKEGTIKISRLGQDGQEMILDYHCTRRNIRGNVASGRRFAFYHGPGG